MTELQHAVSTYELYERLIDRLGLALEMASTAVRLRNESPAVLELKGLSSAEFELIEAYLEKGAMAANGAVKGTSKGCFTLSLEQTGLARAPGRSATIIWLKDRKHGRTSMRSGRNN
ncbi:hypothetical protein [Pseudomonas alliivorans]|uniref:hypothetical protein n=1 Tax=Pseudomonas alliivorans TaxID=2810613 RepID=UPI002ED0A1A1|nr:hypothetical protein [Pseudomonas alliivorans]MEE4649280.1 hypothetical protein [Pseudomonas alliivorans]MEE4744448.1 hypothetical protein [Pseudomonas alliivorans]MEE5098815.1 hypothetical protein [Pseudomonas alliivorans]MEE5130282.1 hypothetical protein [Pseudomonas alliivorans]